MIYSLPFFLEAIDFKVFGIQPNGSPISIGFLFLVGLGFKYYDIKIFGNNLFNNFLLVIIGLFISAFFSDTILNDLARTLALLIGVVSGIFVSMRILENKLVNQLIYFFAALNLYWVYYVQHLYFSGEISTEFHFNSFRQGIETVNSHAVGIVVSTSAIYLFTYFFLDNRLIWNFIGISILILSVFTLILVQTRSNVFFLIFISFIVLIMKFHNKINIYKIIFSLFLCVMIFFLLSQFALNFGGVDSSMAKRFDFEDDEYQQSTTELRRYVYVVFLNKLGTNFFGTGIVRPLLYIGLGDTTNLLMHNQYATYVVAGGWISLIGVIGWLRSLFGYFRRFFNNFTKLKINILALNMAILIYFITLFTVEHSSILFFILFGLLVSQSFNDFKLKAK